ncbi:MAG: DNA-directed RNA polymerase subunit alpha [Candidatus Zambryskibacteria bacterium RIFCSPHIGHO2_12_FULL_38_34]|uniref:DNA-directed RNA polymerase subunit alpha n=1 Tax=Candidatus Zambryskibacteria bacterium RIFCSPLOWO2_12_FULL_39_16 TaxID=1802775 RepID=A0A1G2USN0_9BACT|nr:MAG: DNA-directed RNA polymerase subunit alpha [Candidatus Zambryskibacteria bacterium RIFCSPHIGHO2_02_FULL_38_22]OHA98369.1 MAG: DNA-directed RNA polymerase subunit alpha [Candidatus Zambryskibacteria bacterium RIFCSPHIGHO2_12_FULL_38_34]OHB08392.1 MAG: DNA-directed RNA polymerase subunit alpha [Candidatus Zambryskibacteria bacterium RIFCSPLOWO2_02_FULL_38_13]OHB12376.1 MAG: DNA-directed RNA polymerase subunit alpha [Candidatus Zambryskibacteria bacterium RIFCSPLOWO2_12_FULL_39_16]
MVLPSKPKVVREEGNKGIYEIDGFYPGYGFTIGNSLRRIILSSLPGAAITSVKIAGVEHEFSSIKGIKEDVVMIMLNLKRIRIKILSNESQTLTIKAKGVKTVTAKDIEAPGQVEIINPELVIATLTDKDSELNIEITVEKGLGFVSRDMLGKNKVDIGTIVLDANFTPIIRVNYEVENMRVGDRTDFNRLRISIETDGSISPKEALEKSIYIMMEQLKAIVGFKETEDLSEKDTSTGSTETSDEKNDSAQKTDSEFLKTRIENLNLSARTLNALSSANIRTIGGLARKREKDILEIEGLGAKGVAEIKRVLGEHGITLK